MNLMALPFTGHTSASCSKGNEGEFVPVSGFRRMPRTNFRQYVYKKKRQPASATLLAWGRNAGIFCRVNDLIANNVAGNNDFRTSAQSVIVDACQAFRVWSSCPACGKLTT